MIINNKIYYIGSLYYDLNGGFFFKKTNSIVDLRNYFKSILRLYRKIY